MANLCVCKIALNAGKGGAKNARVEQCLNNVFGKANKQTKTISKFLHSNCMNVRCTHTTPGVTRSSFSWGHYERIRMKCMEGYHVGAVRHFFSHVREIPRSHVVNGRRICNTAMTIQAHYMLNYCFYSHSVSMQSLRIFEEWKKEKGEK